MWGRNVDFLARSGHSLFRSTRQVVPTAPRCSSIGGIVRKRQFETTFLVAENTALLASAGTVMPVIFVPLKDCFGWPDFWPD